MSELVTIESSAGVISGRLIEAPNPTGGILLAHGAGTDQHHPVMNTLRSGLSSAGFTVMTFNYPYTEAGRKRPDPQSRLLDSHRAARDFLMGVVGEPVVLAGRSMGGRMGTYLAAAGEPTRAVVCYAYPLHAAGKPEKLRAEHLPAIKVPMLFFQGIRDPLSRMELFDQYIAPLPNATTELIEADHSLGGLKKVVWQTEKTVEWLRAIAENE